MSDALLSVDNVHAGYIPGVDILRGVSIGARPNEIMLVVGPNGSGKSTLLRTIFGLLRAHEGTISFGGRDTAAMKSSDLKAAGISYVPQDINSFPQLTVEENLLMGAWVFRRDKERLQQRLAHAYQTFPAFAAKRRDRAGSLSGGQGRMLSRLPSTHHPNSPGKAPAQRAAAPRPGTKKRVATKLRPNPNVIPAPLVRSARAEMGRDPDALPLALPK